MIKLQKVSIYPLLTVMVLLALTNSCKNDNDNNDPIPEIQNVTVTDIDGNVYKTVTIGSQVWMAENLKTTKYNNGISIPLIENYNVWVNLQTPAYCWYNNDITYKDSCGAFYNWYAVNTGKLCPVGWHIPTETDWATLAMFLGGENVAGRELKSTKTYIWKFNTPSPSVIAWKTPGAGATNSTGFSALPCGYRNYSGGSVASGYEGCWWSSLEFSGYNNNYAYYQSVSSSNDYLSGSTRLKIAGMSVRCIKD